MDDMVMMGANTAGRHDAGLPDLSHLTLEERMVIEQVLNRQKQDEQTECIFHHL